MYRTLDAGRIIATLEQRIAARFPDAGLRKVCNELLEVARDSKLRAATAARPNRGLRVGVAALLGLGLLLLAYVASIIEVKRDAENLYGVLQGIDAAMNILVLMGAGVLFLLTVEARSNRARALAELNELRSIVHVIDMHQLTKDPSAHATVGTGTPVSPQRQLTPFELVRYLGYCSETLSRMWCLAIADQKSRRALRRQLRDEHHTEPMMLLVSPMHREYRNLGLRVGRYLRCGTPAAKVAALYTQETRAPVVVETESDLVQITSNLSNKIWQKITIVQYHLAAGDGAKAGSAAWPPVAKANPVQPSRQVLDP